MSCISVSALRIGGIGVSASRLGGINAEVERLGGILASASRIGGITVGASRLGGINLTVGLVCDIGVGKYLRVIPQEAQWITVEMPIDYNVLSNTDWSVN